MPPASATPAAATPLRIVLADDHAVVRAGLRGLINDEAGMRVVGEAESGEEAVKLATELRPDVVVMDLSMPGIGGAGATERIVERAPGVRVLVLTMHDDRAHLMRVLDAGASGYVVKRAAGDELLRAIRIVGAGDTYVDPRIATVLVRKSTTSAGGVAQPQPLSSREEEVLRRIAWGESNKAIAAALDISTRTVETYKARISDKLGLRTRPEIVRYALEQGWLTQSQ